MKPQKINQRYGQIMMLLIFAFLISYFYYLKYLNQNLILSNYVSIIMNLILVAIGFLGYLILRRTKFSIVFLIFVIIPLSMIVRIYYPFIGNILLIISFISFALGFFWILHKNRWVTQNINKQPTKEVFMTTAKGKKIAKEELQLKVVLGGIVLILISVLWWLGGTSGCFLSIAIQCTPHGLNVTIVNGTTQDYALANQVYQDAFILGALKTIPAFIGAIVAIGNKRVTEIIISINKKGAKVKVNQK